MLFGNWPACFDYWQKSLLTRRNHHTTFAAAAVGILLSDSKVEFSFQATRERFPYNNYIKHIGKGLLLHFFFSFVSAC